MSILQRMRRFGIVGLEAGAIAGCALLALGAAHGPDDGVATREPAASPGLSLPGPLPFHYDILTFRGAEQGSTAVVAAVAVPVQELWRERHDGGFRYRFDVRFVLADTARGSVDDTIDSVFVAVPRRLSRRHLLHTVVEVPARPSSTTLQRIIVTDAARPGYGQLYQSSFPIPDYSGTELMLSDVAFGLPGARRGWRRRDVTLALLPTDQFPESEFDVYYEVYNLPPGRPYETEIAIEPVDEDGQPEDDGRVVRTTFRGESRADARATFGELRRVASALDRGRYRITVTVTDDVDGRTATRSRIVEVRGWRGGATLVPALPKRGGVAGAPAGPTSAGAAGQG